MLDEIPQLFTQIQTLKQLNDNLKKVDSLRIKEQDLFKEQICIQEDSIKGLKKSLNASKRKIKRRNWTIFGLTIVGAGAALFGVFK